MNRLNSRRMTISILGPLAFILLLGMAGCASTGTIGPAKKEAAVSARESRGWWYANFDIAWPRGKDPAWYMDVLLAREVVSPVLQRYRKDISLWRFHRRAARDQSGDQFAFIFRTSASNARKIYAALLANPVLRRLEAKGLILKVLTDDTNKIPRPAIEDTSDPNWSLPLQKAWPYFIMGVSETWLDLISRYEHAAGDRPRSIAEMQTFYQKINRKLDATWQNEGGHAFLHHLDALFGYGPLNVIVRRKVELQF